MTRQTFAVKIEKKVGVPWVTILTVVSILAGNIPALITALCPPDTPEGKVRWSCRHRPVATRRRIARTLPPELPRNKRNEVAKAIRDEIAQMEEEQIKQLLEESDAS